MNRQYTEKAERIKKVSSKIAKMITPTIPKEEITYVLDSDRVTDWATKVLAKAKKKAWGIIPHARNSVFDASNPKGTAAALKKNGVELKFLRKVTKDNIDFIEEMGKYAEIRHYPGPDFAFLDIDGKGVLLSAVPDDGTSDVGIWIGHPSMIKLFEDYFTLKFEKGTSLNVRIKELRKVLVSVGGPSSARARCRANEEVSV